MDSFDSHTLLGLSGVLLVAVALAILTVALFELAMAISVVAHPRLAPERKVLWLVGMVLLHPFVAIAYFFTDRRTR